MRQGVAVNLLNLQCLACLSFKVKFVRSYFTTLNIIKGFFIAFFLSMFILLEYLDVNILQEVFAYIGFGYLIAQDKKVAFLSGFFVGIFWFYWISFSFIHYGFWYLLPIAIIGVALIYAFLFWLCFSINENPWIKATLLILFSIYIHPFGFNWFDLRLPLVNSIFKLDILSTFLFFFSATCFFTCKKYWKILSIVFLLFSYDTSIKKLDKLPFNIELINSNIPQGQKWDINLRDSFINDNLVKIDRAISDKKRVIIFPESAFPTYLNKMPNLLHVLKEKSLNIAIITGALTYENDKFYNSTYLFDKGKMQVFHKVILVPFGEEIPLPKFLKDWINDVFYDGAEDFSTALKPQDFTIDDIKIRNAICFEATTPLFYEDNPKFLIALSNNAWFTPSSEPILQHLLLKLFSRLHKTTIYHSVNGSKSEIIY